MKKLLLILFVGCFGYFSSSAQASRDQGTLHIKTSVECDMCQKRIEHYFKKVPGVRYLHVNYRSKIVTVKYIPTRISPSMIRTDIANIGYDADTVKANPEAYKRLPACCKKGGMKAKKEAEMKKRRAKLRKGH